MNLAWDSFCELPGDRRRNWELLCREVVRRHYERYGPLLTRKQQPGVEFHLKVEHAGSELGDSGRHWGWQCKWFDAAAFRTDGNLRTDQRSSIEKAIDKSAAHVPTLTDWVLWTKDKFSGEDQRWFEGLNAPFTLRKADEETLAGMLTGPAEILRQTWFGDLVLDRAALGKRWREALAPISNRYVGELHVDVPAHQGLTNYLPDIELRKNLEFAKERLEHAHGEIIMETLESPDEFVRDLGRDVSNALVETEKRLASLVSVFDARGLPNVADVESAAGNRSALDALRKAVARELDQHRRGAAALGEGARALAEVEEILHSLSRALQAPLLAVLGMAGAGKTHLAANLSGPEGQPRGVLILGRQFGAEIEDDDLSRKAGIGGECAELLEALEALGIREGRRVPLVIDGLNESRDPRSWRVTLARLAERLRHFPHVLAVVTLRPSYREFAIPEGTPTIEIQGFEGAEHQAVDRYFEYYKIDADPTALEWWRPSEPLLLSTFCQTVNPAREHTVGPEDLPRSLHEVFENYLDRLLAQTADRLRVDPQAVERAVHGLAWSFFKEGERELGVGRVAEILEDDQWSAWERTLRFQLEAEGLLQRDVAGEVEVLDWSYDLLGGHLIAKAILGRHPDRAGLADEGIASSLGSHPLCEDVIVGLTGLLAAEGLELVGLLAPVVSLSDEATLASAHLAAHEVGETAVGSMIGLFASRPEAVLEAISPLTLRSGHPLNGRLLDVLLRELRTWERDLVWTEWIRHRLKTARAQLSELTRRWRDGPLEDDEDASLAWATWLLTTTQERLRDETVYALYEFGRRDPKRLFSRAIEMLSLSDPSVPEGLLAASYGVAMSMQVSDQQERSTLIEFAAELDRRLLADDASQPTCHWLIREYAFRTTQLASWLSSGAFPARADAAQPPFPQPRDQPTALSPGDEAWAAVHGAFRMDFSNYSIGRLVEGRTPYEDEHPRFLRVTGEIRARVADLGWTTERFLEIDREIGSSALGASEQGGTERYGKKYAWVGFYEAAGRISDRRELPVAKHLSWRLSDIRIDPSFPKTIETTPPPLAEWAPPDGEDETWVRHGHIDLPDDLLCREEDGTAWLLVDGYLECKSTTAHRRVFCEIRGMIALDDWATVASYLADHRLDSEVIPQNSGGYYYFAGEAPWSPTFDSHAADATAEDEPGVRMLGRMEDGPGIELIAVDFSWESYHSVLNDARIGSLPSKAFSRHAGLRKLADRAEFVDAEGLSAARSMAIRAPGWSGVMLWARQDLVEAYSTSRGGEWGWDIRGERELLLRDSFNEPPDWLNKARRQGDGLFRRVVSLAEIDLQRA